jgi:hypothetical protein
MSTGTQTFVAKYWHNEGRFQAVYEKLYKKLVPFMGGSGSEHGEALRAISKIYYDRYNNGFGNGPFFEQFDALRRTYKFWVRYLDDPVTWLEFMDEFELFGWGADVVSGHHWVGDGHMEKITEAVIQWVAEVEGMECQ